MIHKMTQEKIAKIIRVNHAGEFGAKRIYEGQMAFIKDKKAQAEILEMYHQELEHLDYFTKKMQQEKVRPTALMPLWNIAGYVLGATTSLMGKQTAMACTEAVEEVIIEHYQQQKENLDKSELKEKITKFQSDEDEHRKIAKKHIENDNLEILKGFIKNCTKTAIKLSKKY